MGRPHVLVMAQPAQGHVMPLMELSHNLVDRGFKITFVNTEFIHNKLVAAAAPKHSDYEDFIEMVCLPDGMDADADRSVELTKMIEKIVETMPQQLEDLIKNINQSNNGADSISCVISDLYAGWAVKVAKKMSIPSAAFWPGSADLIATLLHIPKLIQDGIITAEGSLIKRQKLELCPTMPAMNTTDFCWLYLFDEAFERSVFKLIVQNNSAVDLADYFICNSFYELEPSAFTLIPKFKPIGPLSASSRMAQFWPEDSTCLSWLDQQPVRSVVYVAFGSIAVLDKRQFDELALGLELSGQPFLWVVRQNLINNEATGGMYPDGFQQRVGSRGMIIGWAPQREVLAHPSVACFVSHCGWNSAMEALSRGVPFLCWPYFFDQIVNRNYICDVWKIGVGFNKDENGIISKEEIKTKVLGLLADEEIKTSALKLKEVAMTNVSIGGASAKNFDDFIEAIKCNPL